MKAESHRHELIVRRAEADGLAVLDGSAPDAQIQTLLAMSYDMTAPGHGRTVKKRNENQAAAAHLR